MTLKNLKIKNSETYKPSRWKKEFITISEYYNKLYKQIECNPIGQRPPVPDYQNIKKEGIIRSILWRINIGEITIVRNVASMLSKFIWDSLDGGHRKRYIWEYMNNEFTVDGKYFNQLSKKANKYFLNYSITFVFYEPMNNFTKGVLFRKINDSTHINHQEELNSYGNTAIANMIRETVRQIKLNNEQFTTRNHPIFETTRSTSGLTYNYKFIDFKNDRLFIDELITQLVYRYTQKSLLGGTSNENSQNMYISLANNEKIVKTLHKKLNIHLDILLKFAKARKNLFKDGLSQKDWRLLNYLICYMIDEYKKFNIKDFDTFIKEYKTCYNLILEGGISNKTKINYKEKLHNVKWDEKGRTISEAFKQYLNVPYDSRKIEQAVYWFLDEFEIKKYITILDKKRVYYVKEKEDQLIKQKFLCYIDNLPLLYAEAEAGHKIAHKKGGKTNVDNLVMIRKIHNTNMGTMPLEQYKKMFILEKINSENDSYNNLTNNLTANNSPNTAANGHATL